LEKEEEPQTEKISIMLFLSISQYIRSHKYDLPIMHTMNNPRKEATKEANNVNEQVLVSTRPNEDSKRRENET
jgi:hypothetical protein